MPEVINLLSSSPEPEVRPAKPKPKPQRDKTTTTTTAAKSLRDAPPGKGPYTLSSDDIFEPQIGPPKLSDRSNNEQTKPSWNAFSFDSLPALPSDDEAFGLSTIKSLKARSHSKSEKSTKSANPGKRDQDFIYLSDDFDSSVNLDESINGVRGPVLKKARTSNSFVDTAIKKPSQHHATSSSFRAPTRGAGQESSRFRNETSSKDATNLPKLKKSANAVSQSFDADPLVFTSSPDPYVKALRRKMDKKKHNSTAKSSFLLELSSDTEISDIETLPVPSKSRSASSATAFENYEVQREKEKKVNAKLAEKVQKEADSKEGKIRKAAAKEAEQEKKRLEKEAKSREKEIAAAIAKVNTLRTDKKVSAPEMIVVIPSSLEPKLSAQTGALLDNFKIEHTEWDSELPIVKFRRKVTALYDDEEGQWMPCDQHIKKEKHAIYVLNAQEFVDLVLDKDETNDLDASILRLKARFEDYKIMILMQGYHTWTRRNQNIKNRQYTQAVRAAGPRQEDVPTASQQRKKKKDPEFVDEELLEQALLRLQMIHGLLIHHTAVMQETAEQLAVFTQHISLIPYKTQKQSSGTTFCMEAGQVKSGDGPADSYVKMLQEMVRVTAGVAYSITAKYPTVRELVDGLQANGPLDLADCRKSSNKNGAFTDQRVGPAISKRVYNVFLGRDPNSLDV